MPVFGPKTSIFWHFFDFFGFFPIFFPNRVDFEIRFFLTSDSKMSSKSEHSAVISTTLGGNDGSEKFVPENEASSDEEFCPSHENTTHTNNLQNAPDEDLKLSQICPTTAGTGYTKCDISTLRFTQESTLYRVVLQKYHGKGPKRLKKG